MSRKSRRTHQGAKSKKEDSWQIIYMDLMTIIMVFFVILWSINQGKDIGISETVGDQTTRMVSLPGDILFKAGKADFSGDGRKVMKSLFHDESGSILNFQTSGLVKRLLVFHGHTDSDGDKDENIDLGYLRARRAYEEVKRFNSALVDHAVICTHADNTPEIEVPRYRGKISKAQREVLRAAKSKNRRITIEDKLVNKFEIQ